MRLSVVVAAYDMGREIPRTLATLAVPYQRDVSPDDYEVVVVDNGSPTPLSERDVGAFGPNFRLARVPDPTPSPVPALRLGARLASGDHLAYMIDGARMLSPRCLALALRAFHAFPGRTVVTVPSWHLGPDVQNVSVPAGYDREVEDALLAGVDWRADGYELFSLCERLDPSSEAAAWFKGLPESNFVAVPRSFDDEIGGFDPGFVSAGGGLANLDYLSRLVGAPTDAAGAPTVVCLMGEGTFHQVHGGVSTNVAGALHPWKRMEAEYAALRGHGYVAPDYEPIVLGSMGERARAIMARTPNIFTFECPVGRYHKAAFVCLSRIASALRSPRRGGVPGPAA